VRGERKVAVHVNVKKKNQGELLRSDKSESRWLRYNPMGLMDLIIHHMD